MTTPREQLAKLIFCADNHNAPESVLLMDLAQMSKNCYAYTIADAIIAAGWTPPPPATNNTHTNN